MTDSFDPTAWQGSSHEFRVYGDDNAQIWSVVDEEDYLAAIQFQWSPKFSRCGRKFYLRRNMQVGVRSERLQVTLFLHTFVIERTGLTKPSKQHKLVDHRDGDAMNCRRSNLRWATHSMNVKNRFGRFGYEIVGGV